MKTAQSRRRLRLMVLTSLAIAVLATIHAARRASQLEPVEAIRAE